MSHESIRQSIPYREHRAPQRGRHPANGIDGARSSRRAALIRRSSLRLGRDLGENVGEVSQAVQDITLDIRRSLVVTEQPILERFTFQRVMTQLAAQSGVSGLTALGLFQQWWDTQTLRAPAALDRIATTWSTLSTAPC